MNWTQLSALLLAASGAATCQAQAVHADTLADDLFRIGEQRLSVDGLHIDANRSTVVLSTPVRQGSAYAAKLRPRRSGSDMPLVFELKEEGPLGSPVTLTASLSGPLTQDVLVASRRLPRAASVSCADLQAQRREIRAVPRGALVPPCELPPASLAHRTLVASEILREGDVRLASAVEMSAPVVLKTTSGNVTLEVTGVALSSGNVGDVVAVRLPTAKRPVQARVVAYQSAVVQELP